MLLAALGPGSSQMRFLPAVPFGLWPGSLSVLGLALSVGKLDVALLCRAESLRWDLLLLFTAFPAVLARVGQGTSP